MKGKAMLYDPKWEAPVEAKPSLQGFIAWLETKNPRGRYQFDNCAGMCLLGQYMAFLGIEWGESPKDPNAGNWAKTAYMKTARCLFPTSGPMTVLADRPHTFGAALKRARAYSH